MGKPKPLNLSSFILLDPEAMMKLDGQSMSSLWAGLGGQKTLKGIQRFLVKRPPQIPKTLKVNLNKVLNQFPDFPCKTQFLLAIDGDTDAQNSINSLGQWEFYRLAFPATESGGAGIWIDHLVEIEKASQLVDRNLGNGEFTKAAEHTVDSPTLKPYFSAAAIARLSGATSDKEALLARMAGLCEVLLSQIARVECLSAGSAIVEDGFSYLTEFEAEQLCKPGRRFFAWLRQVMGGRTLAELRTLATRNNVPVIDESTIKRWSSGREFPRPEKLDQFVAALQERRESIVVVSVPYGRIHAQYWAARRLQKLLDLARIPWGAESKIQGANRPWTEMMEHDSAEAWIHARYPFWQDHWKHHLRDRAKGDGKSG